VAVHPIWGRVASLAEEDVAMGLHQVLPGDDTLVLAGELAAPAGADQDRRLGPRDSAALPSRPWPDPCEKPAHQTFRPRHQSSLSWPLPPVQPGDAAELYALPTAPLVLIPVKRATWPPASPHRGEKWHGGPRVVNPSMDGPFATTGHRASIIGAEFHVDDLRVTSRADRADRAAAAFMILPSPGAKPGAIRRRAPGSLGESGRSFALGNSTSRTF
jgi:hypothetical protein